MHDSNLLLAKDVIYIDLCLKKASLFTRESSLQERRGVSELKILKELNLVVSSCSAFRSKFGTSDWAS
jgi:hypothetical protein